MSDRTSPSPLCARPLRLDQAAMQALLPHRAPLLLCAEASWVEPGRRGFGVPVDLGATAEALFGACQDEVPWPLVLEALAQLGALVTLTGRRAAAAAAAAAAARAEAEPAAPAAAPVRAGSVEIGILLSVPSLAIEAPFARAAPITLEAAIEREHRGSVSVRIVAWSGARRALAGQMLLGLAR